MEKLIFVAKINTMRHILLFCFFFHSYILHSKNVDESVFAEIEKLIDNQELFKAEKKLQRYHSIINMSSPKVKILYYCNSGYLNIQKNNLDIAQESLNVAMQLIYDNKLFNHEEHMRVAYYIAKTFYLKEEYNIAERLLNVALVRSSDIWEESKYSKYMFELLLLLYEKLNVPSGVISRLKFEINKMPMKSHISNEKQVLEDKTTVYNQLADTFSLESYIMKIDSISYVLSNSGQYIQAERILDDADSTLLRHGQQYNTLKRRLYVRRGMLRFMIKDINNAKEFFLIAKRLYEKENDITSTEYANCLNSLALVYQEQSQIIYSTLLLYSALASIKSGISKNRNINDFYELYLSVNDNLARNYYSMNEKEQALKTWNELIIVAEKEGYWSNAFSAIINYAFVQMELGNYQDQEGINRLKSIMYKDNSLPKEAGYQYLLMAQYLANDKDVLNTLRDYIDFSKTNINSILSTYSESEREQYWNQQAMVLEWITNAICWKFKDEDLFLLALNITHTLRSMQLKLYQTIRNYYLHDAPLGMKEKYQDLILCKQKLANKSTHKDSLSTIRDNIITLEKTLLRNLNENKPLFDDSVDYFSIIKSSLSENEVAIEFIQIPEIVSSDSINILYAAWIIRKEYKHPILLKVCYEEEVDDILYQYPETAIYSNNENASAQLYELIIKPLERYLKEGDTIYYLPVGEIHRINLMAIPFNGIRLMDNYSLIRVSSSDNIAMKKTNSSSYKTAVLYGGINFHEGIDEMSTEAKKYSDASPIRHSVNRSICRSLWDELPGSLFEVKEINSILSSNNTSTTLITGKQANEESVKAFSGKSPDVIHIATHGFYYSETKQKIYSFFDNTFAFTQKNMFMQSCGLLFAGANNVWSGNEIPEGMEDGILTAEEISHIDLTNTKLCVLSACNTGLGEIDDIEGVYGLQHALKMAGVESILMCLNKVDDEATRILMVEFYKNLMSGNSKHQSLLNAQHHLRTIENGKYDDPKYWAPFILLDGLY